MSRNIETNQAMALGEIEQEFTLSHEVVGEGFYTTMLAVRRLSDTIDHIPIMVSDRAIDMTESWTGRRVKITGSFRSYNSHSEKKNRLILHLFADEVIEVGEDEDDEDEVTLEGYICKQPVYRKTPLGKEICDVLIAVNRMYSKSDYIPIICWGRNAKFASNLPVGTRIRIAGRIQSREYIKWDETGTTSEERMAFEVSVNKIEKLGSNTVQRQDEGAEEEDQES